MAALRRLAAQPCRTVLLLVALHPPQCTVHGLHFGAPAQPPKHTVVVGGGFGGTYTALALAKLRPRDRITVVDARDRFAFLPLLYDYACGLAERDDVSVPFSTLFAGCPNVDFAHATVDAIDPAQRTVSVRRDDGATRLLDDGTAFDAVVVALGREPVVPPTEAAGSDYGALVQPFYRLEDAEALRRKLAEWRDSETPPTVAVVGGGYTGVELACHLARALKVTQAASSSNLPKPRVVLAHRSSRLVPAATPHNRAAATRALRAAGVDVALDVDAALVGTTEAGKARLRLNTDETLDADLVLWTAATRLPAPIRALGAPYRAAPRGGDNSRAPLAVDAALRLRLPARSRRGSVVALGDAARGPPTNAGKEADPPGPSAQLALQQAVVAARNVAGYFDGRPARPFAYVPLGELLAYGPADASGSLLPGLDRRAGGPSSRDGGDGASGSLLEPLLDLDGAPAALARRLIYAARMPTPEQRLTALAGLARSSAASSSSSASSSAGV